MSVFARPVEVLIDELGRLPGVGPKSAQRIAFHLLKTDKTDSKRLADALISMKDNVTFCSRCFNVAEIDVTDSASMNSAVSENYQESEIQVQSDLLSEPSPEPPPESKTEFITESLSEISTAADFRNAICSICNDSQRVQNTICVVEEPKDISAIEKTGSYKGLYHVLLGVINPLEGIGPDKLKINELAKRSVSENIDEVIICTNPNLEGETTAAFIANKVLAPLGIKVSRLASGLPVGGDLEYADEITLGRALEGRKDF